MLQPNFKGEILQTDEIHYVQHGVYATSVEEFYH